MDKYRVIVMRESTTEADETLFELAGSAALVQGIVPGVLDAVLVEPATAGRELADRVFDQATAAGRAAEQQAEGDEATKTKRNRRTKQQIADDKAAQALGFRDAAHRAEVETAQQAPALPEAVPGGVNVPEQAYVPPAGEVVAGSVPGAIVSESPAAPVEPPYNPFAS